MKLEKTATGLIVREPDDAFKRKCLQYFSLNKPIREFFIYTGNDPDNQGILKKGGKDVIYITSGFLEIKDQYIEKLKREVREVKPVIGKKIQIDMNREPRSPLQVDCIKKLTTTQHHKTTVELKPGVGKAEPYNRKIPTPTKNGYTLMVDLQVGDYVYDQNGHPTQVDAIFERGTLEVYKITFADGRTSYCAGDHLWNVKVDNRCCWETVSTNEMIDYLEQKRNLYIPKCQPVEYNVQFTPLDPYIIGVFIGQPYYSDKLIIEASCGEAVAKICKLLNLQYRSYGKKAYEIIDLDGYSISPRNFFQDIPEMYDNEYLSIPQSYMVNTPNKRLSLLNGLMDIRGSVDNTNIYYWIHTQKPNKIINQIAWLINSFGHSCKINEPTIKRYGDYSSFLYSCIIDATAKFKTSLFTLNSKYVEFKPTLYRNNNAENLKVLKIEYDHDAPCRCIQVRNKHKLYLTEGFLVTHNTFISLYAISKLQLKPLIVAPTTMLKNQWIDNFIELGINKDNIATRIEDSPNKDFCVVTISSIENAIREDWNLLSKILDQAKFGIKVTDESHLHLKGILKLDAIANIQYNWYLSATLGRSDPSEDKILNRALLDADRFIGNASYQEYKEEFVEIYMQDIWYNPSRNLCDKTFKFGSKGLVRSTYYNMLMEYKGGVPFINNIISTIKRMHSLMKTDKKMIVLIPIIGIIDTLLKHFDKDPYFNKYSYGKIDGSMSVHDRNQTLESDIIVSTSMSMGTGMDVSNLICVINFDQYASPIITEQIVGRLRQRGWKCYYVDICDHVRYARSFENWGRKRRILFPYFPGVYSEMKKLPNIHC